MKLLSVHTHTSIEIPNYRIQYRNAYYISIEGCKLQLLEDYWHPAWFKKWNKVQRRM